MKFGNSVVRSIGPPNSFYRMDVTPEEPTEEEEAFIEEAEVFHWSVRSTELPNYRLTPFD